MCPEIDQFFKLKFYWPKTNFIKKGKLKVPFVAKSNNLSNQKYFFMFQKNYQVIP
ncbi:hypothetical protein M153_4530001107 [Pseudoloma neurophilia]|uniref:Uncharacterized protein n=1 Tax=Pseudoloma neurophilia TaxID=146866 RepID=A0A0R0LXC7_9MICR|nr:hypothetical protein M153_4530001107 [Pseudoloma neurophilia]